VCGKMHGSIIFPTSTLATLVRMLEELVSDHFKVSNNPAFLE
jgi:hypothetical protein